jgi:hypothetical protein
MSIRPLGDYLDDFFQLEVTVVAMAMAITKARLEREECGNGLAGAPCAKTCNNLVVLQYQRRNTMVIGRG